MESKRRAGIKAVEYVKDGMIVGLGTGSTAYYAIEEIGKRVKQGLNISAVATSVGTESNFISRFWIVMKSTTLTLPLTALTKSTLN